MKFVSPIVTALVCLFSLTAAPLQADELRLRINGNELTLAGEILIEGQDNSLFFRQDTGRIWIIQPDQVISKVDDDTPVKPVSHKELGERLLKELPAGFSILKTKHYVIAYQTEVAYARWVSGLYESRLYRQFEQFWESKHKFKLKDPDFPLVVIIFGTRVQYQQFVDRELGPGQTMPAYYNLETNRVAMFDLTTDQIDNRNMNNRRIEQVLRNPAAATMVANLIHEATHQLMFNRGLQTRFAESPLWLNEGLANFFEAPNLQSKRGWIKPGLIFEQRLMRFRQYLANRPLDSLESLISSNERLENADTALDAYAEAWAFNHFLVNRHSDKFIAYMQHMSQKEALGEDTPQVRLAEFKRHFGADLAALDREFVDYVMRLK